MSKAFNIGVAIPTYSRPQLLAQLIRTIPSDIRIFVSDNARSMCGYSSMFSDNVLISHSDTLIPMFANWNRALGLVPDDVTHVLIPSDDDLYLPQAFVSMAQAVIEHPKADVFVFGCGLVDEAGRQRHGYTPKSLEIMDQGQGFLKFANGVDARMPGVLFRKDFLSRIGTFDEAFELTAADSDLIQRSLLLGRSVFIPLVVGLYRVWPGSLTHSRQASDEWMNEIEIWTDKIVGLLKSGYGPEEARLNAVHYKGEIVAQNLLAGVAGLIGRHEYKEAHKFISRYETPASAKFRTQLSLARRRLEAWMYTRL